MILEISILTIYCLALFFIFLFSVGQLHLTWHYLKANKKETRPGLSEYPIVTVQLPVYNEKYVVERLIDAVCQLEYPSEKLEVQVLDDSNDETHSIISEKVAAWQAKGVDIKHVTRKDRQGFKAGALQYGLEIAKGDFIAIFDADFLPNPDFLIRSMNHFDDHIGMVQCRWGHLNRNYSMLTRLQAFGLDAHFTVEQVGRNHAGSFINFNGTGGVWRRSCIEDAGGWSADTLTEDLDLSYRAQLKGWKFKYLESTEAPAELPVLMAAIKSQQYRWNKGAAETAVKNSMKVFRSSLSFTNKLHAFFHLFNSSVFVCLLLAAVLSVPVLYITSNNPQYKLIFNLGWIFLIGFFSIALYYWIATKRINPEDYKKKYFKLFPSFLVVSMGLSLHNGLAVIEGLLGRKTPFVRTPKFNIISKSDSWKGNTYIKPQWNVLTFFEGLLSLYFGFGIYMGLRLHDFKLLIFHFMLFLGFAIVFFYSIKSVKSE